MCFPCRAGRLSVSVVSASTKARLTNLLAACTALVCLDHRTRWAGPESASLPGPVNEAWDSGTYLSGDAPSVEPSGSLPPESFLLDGVAEGWNRVQGRGRDVRNQLAVRIPLDLDDLLISTKNGSHDGGCQGDCQGDCLRYLTIKPRTQCLRLPQNLYYTPTTPSPASPLIEPDKIPPQQLLSSPTTPGLLRRHCVQPPHDHVLNTRPLAHAVPKRRHLTASSDASRHHITTAETQRLGISSFEFGGPLSPSGCQPVRLPMVICGRVIDGDKGGQAHDEVLDSPTKSPGTSTIRRCKINVRLGRSDQEAVCLSPKRRIPDFIAHGARLARGPHQGREIKKNQNNSRTLKAKFIHCSQRQEHWDLGSSGLGWGGTVVSRRTPCC